MEFRCIQEHQRSDGANKIYLFKVNKVYTVDNLLYGKLLIKNYKIL